MGSFLATQQWHNSSLREFSNLRLSAVRSGTKEHDSITESSIYTKLPNLASMVKVWSQLTNLEVSSLVDNHLHHLVGLKKL